VPISSVPVLLIALGALFSAASAIFARAHLKRVTRVASGQTLPLANALKRLPPADRVAALVDRAQAGSLERRLGEDLAQASDDAARSAAVNDLLLEIELSLESSASWPSAAARIAAYSSLLLAALVVVGGHGLLAAGILVVLGVAAALYCVSIDARAKALSRDVCEAFDALVGAVLPREMLGSWERPGRKSEGRRRGP